MEWDDFGKTVKELGERREQISFFAMKGLLDNLNTAEMVGICEQGGFYVNSWINKGMLEQIGFPNLGEDINSAALLSLKLLYSTGGRQAQHIKMDNQIFPKILATPYWNEEEWKLGVIFRTWQPFHLYKEGGAKLFDLKVDYKSLAGRCNSVLHEQLKAKIVLYPKVGYYGKGLPFFKQLELLSIEKLLKRTDSHQYRVRLATLPETVFLTFANFLETAKLANHVWIKTDSYTDDKVRLIFRLHKTQAEISDNCHVPDNNIAYFPIIILWEWE